MFASTPECMPDKWIEPVQFGENIWIPARNGNEGKPEFNSLKSFI